ncbi:DUF4198 domain-containing protein [Campylobacter sp. RM16188]|uniref:DUF4198 domain-containing protein n=1 Tax=Campylobacter sp. RM16188 TaxID=1705725 RepID=UPI0015578559|nr:DUF4198 domain-containing protein [Campylobacter sp. RM16188]
MSNKMLLKAIFIATALTMSAQAHQVVAQSVGKNKFELKFWAHDKFENYASKQVLGAKAYDENLKLIKTGIVYNYDDDKKLPEILTDKSPAVVTMTFDAGHWVQTDKGYVVGDRAKTKGIVFDAIRSVKIGKTYFSWNENFLKPIGLKLEVVALSDPFKIKVGESLPVLVLKDGKPAKNVGFETAKDDIDNVTNEFGIALIPIKEKGLNIIAAKSSEPIFTDESAERMLIQSSISFEVK